MADLVHRTFFRHQQPHSFPVHRVLLEEVADLVAASEEVVLVL